MTKTNLGLVEYAKAQLGNPYWYGTYGQVGNESILNYVSTRYTSMWGSNRVAKARKNHIGKRVHDCVGLMKGYIWSDSPTSKVVYCAKQDKSANGTYEYAKVKGDIASIPEIPGICVHKNGHVGVYIGNGEVIEARGFDYGVVKTKLNARPWEHWFEYPFVTYIKEETPKYFDKYIGTSGSIVDGLHCIGVDSSFSYRKKIAIANEIKLYVGTAKQNTKMLNLLKKGKLIKP